MDKDALLKLLEENLTLEITEGSSDLYIGRTSKMIDIEIKFDGEYITGDSIILD